MNSSPTYLPALPVQTDLDLNQAKSNLKKFEYAPAWSLKKAEARENIIQAFDQFADGKKLTLAKAEFLKKYNAHNPFLGIDEGIYQVFEKISVATLDLWRSKYNKFGFAGLLDSENRGKPSSKITPEIENFIVGLIYKKPLIRSAHIYEFLRHKFSGSDDPLPCANTIYAFINRWKTENQELLAYRQNPDKWKNEFLAAFGNASEKAKYYLHIVELDNTIADVMCSPGIRCTLCFGVDIYTRKAWCLVVPTSRSQSIQALVRKIIISQGLMDVVIIDNGKEFISLHFKAICRSLGIKIIQLPHFSPERKPIVERFIGSLDTMVFENLIGYIGHNITDRKAIEAQKSFAKRMFTKGEVIEISLTPEELQEIINTWIEKVYHQRPHSGLGGKTPEQKAGESTRPVRKILDERVLDILLAPIGRRTVLKKGIYFQNGQYIALELAEHIGQKVELRLDLADAGKLYVFDLEGRFICNARDVSLEGITVEEAKEARKRQRKHLTEQVKAMKALAKDIGDPFMELLASKRQEPGQIISFNRVEEFESDATREAAKAFIESEPVDTFIPDLEEIEQTEKIIQFRDEPVFKFGFERYRYLQEKSQNQALTLREKRWMREYETSTEYHSIFVLPYQEQAR